MTALHALLAESLVLWKARHRLRPLDASSAIVICDGAGAPFVTIEPRRPPSDMARWSVIVATGGPEMGERACGSLLGVLQAVGAALEVSLQEAAAMRLGVSTGVP